jgi:hypothetical protein
LHHPEKLTFAGLRTVRLPPNGDSLALICLQTALVAALKAKGVLTDSEVATLSGVANETLVAMEGVPDDARELAQSALRGFALSWSKRVTRN